MDSSDQSGYGCGQGCSKSSGIQPTNESTHLTERGNLTAPFSVLVRTVLLRFWKGWYGSRRKTFPDLDKLLSIQGVDEVHNNGEDARCQSEGDDFDRHDRTSDVECLVSREVASSLMTVDRRGN